MEVKVLRDDAVFTGIDMKAVVHEMNNACLIPFSKLREYMKTVDLRLFRLYGIHVDTAHRAKGFLEDLEKKGFIEIVSKEWDHDQA